MLALLSTVHVGPTKENCKKIVLVEQFVQHLPVNILNFILDLKHVLGRQPNQDLVRLIEVSIVQQGNLLPGMRARFTGRSKVNQS